MRGVIGVLFFLLVLCAGGIALQIFLSKKENKWAGLVLPLLSFSLSLLVLLNFILFSAGTRSEVLTEEWVVVSETDAGVNAVDTKEEAFVPETGAGADAADAKEGTIVSETRSTFVKPAMRIGEILVTMALLFFAYNIPTAIFLAIYAACRSGRGRKRALDKMSIQDLE
jgi:hypothetical protein